MSKEETKEAVVEEAEVKTEELKSVEATGENTEQDTTGDEDELSPWYYFFSQGCGWCKKSTPVVEELNKEGKLPEILLLDTAEPDNAKLRDELFAEYKVQCGTPFFINADTGENICGFREKDVLEKWLAGEDIPEPPRPSGPPPKWPFQGASEEEEAKFKEEYNKWIKANEHMPDAWKQRNKPADEVLASPRAKSDPPRPPMGPALANATDEVLDKWGEDLGKWQEENKHLENLQPVESILMNIKNRRDQMKQGAPAAQQGQGGMQALNPDQNARITRVEQKIDKLMKHMGVK